jgi:hypothetical protein
MTNDEMTRQEFFLSTHTALIHKEVWRANRRFPNIHRDEILSEKPIGSSVIVVTTGTLKGMSSFPPT